MPGLPAGMCFYEHEHKGDLHMDSFAGACCGPYGEKKGRKLSCGPLIAWFKIQACVMSAQRKLCHHHKERKRTLPA